MSEESKKLLMEMIKIFDEKIEIIVYENTVKTKDSLFYYVGKSK